MPSGKRARGQPVAVNVGVFGGSFDPVHLGHLIVAEAAADALVLDEVRFVPAHAQPLKQGRHGASGEARLAMLELAIARNPRFVVDARELERPAPSYTVDTLQALRNERPEDRLFFLVGADAARDFSAWRAPETIARLATVVVLTRPGAAVPSSALIHRRLEVPAIDVSATDVRERCRAGRSIRYLVPDPVRQYIADRGLYTEGS